MAWTSGRGHLWAWANNPDVGKYGGIRRVRSAGSILAHVLAAPSRARRDARSVASGPSFVRSETESAGFRTIRQPFMLSSPLDEGHYMTNRSKRANLSSLADEIRCTKYSNM